MKHKTNKLQDSMDIFCQGGKAFDKGIKKRNNPYDKDSHASRTWNTGHFEAFLNSKDSNLKDFVSSSSDEKFEAILNEYDEKHNE